MRTASLVSGVVLFAGVFVLTGACESVKRAGEKIGIGPDADRNVFPAFGQTNIDENAAIVKLRPRRATRVLLLFSSAAPAGVRLRLLVQDPGNWPLSSADILETVESRPDGSFPDEASLPVDGTRDLLLQAESYNPNSSTWSRMQIVYPVSEGDWRDVFSESQTSSKMIRWAVRGDAAAGSLGFRLTFPAD